VTPNGNFEGHNVLQQRYPGQAVTRWCILRKFYRPLQQRGTGNFPPARNNQE